MDTVRKHQMETLASQTHWTEMKNDVFQDILLWNMLKKIVQQKDIIIMSLLKDVQKQEIHGRIIFPKLNWNN